MQRSRTTIFIGAVLLVAISAGFGCAGEIAPDPGPAVDPLNPQPLPPVTDKGPPETAGDDDDSTTTGGSPGSSGSNSSQSSSGAASSSGSSGNSSSSSSSSGGRDAN